MTPKDEQTSRIAEREKFLAVLNANFESQQAEISLMRQPAISKPGSPLPLHAQPSLPPSPSQTPAAYLS